MTVDVSINLSHHHDFKIPGHKIVARPGAGIDNDAPQQCDFFNLKFMTCFLEVIMNMPVYELKGMFGNPDRRIGVLQDIITIREERFFQKETLVIFFTFRRLLICGLQCFEHMHQGPARFAGFFMPVTRNKPGCAVVCESQVRTIKDQGTAVDGDVMRKCCHARETDERKAPKPPHDKRPAHHAEKSCIFVVDLIRTKRSSHQHFRNIELVLLPEQT